MGFWDNLKQKTTQYKEFVSINFKLHYIEEFYTNVESNLKRTKRIDE